MIILKHLILTVVGLCLLAGNVNAQTNWHKFVYFSNWGGLNDNLAKTEIADNEASDIQNIIFDLGGAIKKRYGSLTIPNNPVTAVATGAVTGLSFYKKDNGNRYLVATLNDTDNKFTIRKKDYTTGSGWTNTTGWDLIETSSMPSGYSNNYLADFTIAEDNLVFTFNATVQTKPYKWTGTGNVSALTADTDCPEATIVEYHKNHLFLSGNDSYPSRVYFSDLDDITDYTATDFFDVQTADGTRVRGIISAFDSLYVFKDKSIWRLSGTNRDDFVLQKMVSGIGTLSQQSIAVVNNLIIFTSSQNDVIAYDGGYSATYVSTKISNTISNLSYARAAKNLGINFEDNYYVSCSYSGSGTNNRILFLDTDFKAWSKFVGLNANAWTVADDSSAQDILVYGDYSGYVHYYPSGEYYDTNTATSAISAFYETKWFRYPEISLGDKYWRVLRTYALSETTADTEVIAEARADYEVTGTSFTIPLTATGSLWDYDTWDVDIWGGQTLIKQRDEVEKGVDMFQLRYEDEDVDEGFTIFGWELLIEPTYRD